MVLTKLIIIINKEKDWNSNNIFWVIKIQLQEAVFFMAIVQLPYSQTLY